MSQVGKKKREKGMGSVGSENKFNKKQRLASGYIAIVWGNSFGCFASRLCIREYIGVCNPWHTPALGSRVFAQHHELFPEPLFRFAYRHSDTKSLCSHFSGCYIFHCKGKLTFTTKPAMSPTPISALERAPMVTYMCFLPSSSSSPYCLRYLCIPRRN